jgi:hypothetical protein
MTARAADLDEDLQAAQNDVVERIGRKIDGGAAALFQRKRLCGVAQFFGAKFADSLPRQPYIDLTQEIVRLYDQAYPAKGGTPATKPAAAGQKPAPTVPGVKPQQKRRSESRSSANFSGLRGSPKHTNANRKQVDERQCRQN